MAEVNLKNVLSETTDQDNGEDGSHGLKKKRRIIQRVSGPKRGKSHKKRQGNDITHILLQSLYPPRGRKRKSKEQSKKRKKEIS